MFINTLDLTYTSEMEKAMFQSHGMGYAEYSRKLDQRLKVEQEREQDYLQSRRIIEGMRTNP
ncbi:hypothetical protein [Priestia abyssalis]|uniref:hypothetical protein n=1 Tax=Priestia abyssalis TaxID=1221450 RepID=UPI000994A72A|nr:hypothetical protein [Priestia abyssalis]